MNKSLKTTKMSEMEMVQLALSGNKVAMERLISLARPWIVKLAQKLLYTVSEGCYKQVECLVDVEDLVQEGLLEFVQRLKSYNDSRKAKLETYAFYYVRDAMRDLIKGLSRSIPVGDISDVEKMRLEPLENFSSVALHYCVSNFLRRCLNPREVEAVELFYGIRSGHEMRAAEVALAMGTTPSAVNHLIDRARTKLRGHKEELGSLYDCLPSVPEAVVSESYKVATPSYSMAA